MKKTLTRKEARAQGIVCVCNLIGRDAICAAIARGCKTLDRVSAATTAGAGQCGGTCRPEIAELIKSVVEGSDCEAGSKPDSGSGRSASTAPPKPNSGGDKK